jgi:hypothetical protein
MKFYCFFEIGEEPEKIKKTLISLAIDAINKKPRIDKVSRFRGQYYKDSWFIGFVCACCHNS